MLGFGGHFLTKARRYSVTFQAPARHPRHLPPPRRTRSHEHTGAVRAVDHADETTLIVGTLTFAGVGWHTTGDALLANTAAAMARARQKPAAKNSPTSPDVSMAAKLHKPLRKAI